MNHRAGILLLALLSCVFAVACGNDAEILKEISSLKQTVKELQDIVQRQNNFVGFSVKSTVDVHTFRGDTVIYNTVDLDTSSSYNVNTGEFRCGYSGHYQFTVTTHSGGHHVSMLLVKRDVASNKSYYVGAFADSEHADQGAISYVIHCAEGDHVFVEQGYVAGGTMTGTHSNYGGIMNAFSGFLIQLDL